MILQVLRAYSESQLVRDVDRLVRVGWKTDGSQYREGLFWYQAVKKG